MIWACPHLHYRCGEVVLYALNLPKKGRISTTITHAKPLKKNVFPKKVNSECKCKVTI